MLFRNVHKHLSDHMLSHSRGEKYSKILHTFNESGQSVVNELLQYHAHSEQNGLCFERNISTVARTRLKG
jgi:hypothetical protein